MGKFQSTCQISADVRKRLHTLEKAVCIAFLLSMLFSMLGFKSQCEDISDRVLRLHVLANSDTGEDQELKQKSAAPRWSIEIRKRSFVNHISM